jgi:dTDP-4-amino-4,6-dideoxygalactose transaminase
MTIERTAEQTTIPFVDLAAQFAEISHEVMPQLVSALEAGEYVGGRAVADFEKAYAAYADVDHCIGVANGTDAVELALRAAGIGPGDEVIVPANSFIATAEAVSRIGSVPVFVDVDADHLLMDPIEVAAAITPRTRAIIPVHLFGQCAPVERLVHLAQSFGLVIIEDAAQSQGAQRFGFPAGTIGTAAATSFYPGKNLGAAGDAGAVLSNDGAFAERVRRIAAHGSRQKYVHDVVGFNSRLDAIQAIVLTAKLRRLDRWNVLRTVAAERYTELLSAIPEIGLPYSAPGNLDVWHLYVVQVDDRDRILDDLAAAGVSANVHYPTPLHLTRAYQRGYRRGDFPVAEAAAKRILSLPLYPHITAAQQEVVAARLSDAVRGR